MSKKEIDKKFDEIVYFSEIDKFIDTPVKRYSSGMNVRLAFSVAAHLEPDILIVDEVLAVGDIEFQKKCIGKIEDVVNNYGRTVLFVSHNMSSVTRLCNRGLLLKNGELVKDDDILKVSEEYLRTNTGSFAYRNWDSPDNAPGDNIARLKSVRVLVDDKNVESVDIRKPVTLEIEYWNLSNNRNLICGFSFFNEQGVILFVSADFQEKNWSNKPRPDGIYRSKCIIPGNLLSEGQIFVLAEVSTRAPFYEIHVAEKDVVSFQVVDKGEPGSVRYNWARTIPGVVRPKLKWVTEYIGN
jgi:lipopolysaccharide transport system ATP-binding protein